jgi:hypothetical protein
MALHTKNFLFLFNIALYTVYCNSFWAKWPEMGAAMGADFTNNVGFLRFVQNLANVSRQCCFVSNFFEQYEMADFCGLAGFSRALYI